MKRSDDINEDFCCVGKRLGDEGFAKAVATGSAMNRAKKNFPVHRWPLRFVEAVIVLPSIRSWSIL